VAVLREVKGEHQNQLSLVIETAVEGIETVDRPVPLRRGHPRGKREREEMRGRDERIGIGAGEMIEAAVTGIEIETVGVVVGTERIAGTGEEMTGHVEMTVTVTDLDVMMMRGREERMIRKEEKMWYKMMTRRTKKEIDQPETEVTKETVTIQTEREVVMTMVTAREIVMMMTESETVMTIVIEREEEKTEGRRSERKEVKIRGRREKRIKEKREEKRVRWMRAYQRNCLKLPLSQSKQKKITATEHTLT